MLKLEVLGKAKLQPCFKVSAFLEFPPVAMFFFIETKRIHLTGIIIPERDSKSHFII
jgi:hypothetical protein